MHIAHNRYIQSENNQYNSDLNVVQVQATTAKEDLILTVFSGFDHGLCEFKVGLGQYKIFPPAGQVRLCLGRGNHKASNYRADTGRAQSHQVNCAPHTNMGIVHNTWG